jgi:hypothetical protein
MNANTDASAGDAVAEQPLTSNTEATSDDRNLVHDSAPSSQESAASFDSLTEDFLYEGDDFLYASPVQSDITLGNVKLDDVDIGDVIVEADGVEWLCRICFCVSAACCGKTIVRLESGDKDLVRKSQWRRRVYVGDDRIVQS